MRAEIAEDEEPESARAKLAAALESYVSDPDERDWIEPRLAQLLALEDARRARPRDLFARLAALLRAASPSTGRSSSSSRTCSGRTRPARLSRVPPRLVAQPPALRGRARAPGAGSSGTRTGEPDSAATKLSLEPLSRRRDGRAPRRPRPRPPDELRRQVLDRAEGVPLYAVETVRMLLDRGLLEQHAGDYTGNRPVEALEVPETLHALVAARLDGLARSERRLLQDASVVGKTFARSARAGAACRRPTSTRC